MELDPYFTSLTKVNLKWIKDLNLRPETLKVLEEKSGGKLLEIDLVSDCFLFDIKNKDNKSKNK